MKFGICDFEFVDTAPFFFCAGYVDVTHLLNFFINEPIIESSLTLLWRVDSCLVIKSDELSGDLDL